MVKVVGSCEMSDERKKLDYEVYPHMVEQLIEKIKEQRERKPEAKERFDKIIARLKKLAKVSRLPYLQRDVSSAIAIWCPFLTGTISPVVFQQTFEAREGYEQDNIIHSIAAKKDVDYPAQMQRDLIDMSQTARKQNQSKYAKNIAQQSPYCKLFSALLESLKTQSKNQIAATRKNISQAKKINRENETLTDEHQEYANYLNCLAAKMNNSLSTKV